MQLAPASCIFFIKRNLSKMKRIIIFLALCSLQGVALAQWAVGVHGGISGTSITRSHTDRIDETYGSLFGYDFGIEGRYSVNTWLAVRADLDLMQRNHRLQRHLNYISPVYTDHLNTYFTLPLMADFSFGGQRLRGHMLLGGFCGFWLSQRVKGVTYGMTDYDVFFNDFDEQRPFTREERRFNAGLLGGFGLSYGLNENIDLNIEALYFYDLVSHHVGYSHLQDYRYLNTCTLTFGVTYKLSKTEKQ